MSKKAKPLRWSIPSPANGDDKPTTEADRFKFEAFKEMFRSTEEAMRCALEQKPDDTGRKP